MSIKEELHTLVDRLGDEEASAALAYLRRFREVERGERGTGMTKGQDARTWIVSGRDFFAQSHTDLPTLAARQSVRPVTDVDALLGDFWPADETADDFIAAVREWRREGTDA